MYVRAGGVVFASSEEMGGFVCERVNIKQKMKKKLIFDMNFSCLFSFNIFRLKHKKLISNGRAWIHLSVWHNINTRRWSFSFDENRIIKNNIFLFYPSTGIHIDKLVFSFHFFEKISSLFVFVIALPAVWGSKQTVWGENENIEWKILNALYVVWALKMSSFNAFRCIIVK